MLNRLLIAAFVVLFLVALVSAVWNLCDWPPPNLILKYGFPPTGGPTGRTMTIEGVEFVELKPGYFRMGSHFLCQKGDLIGRVCAVLRLPWGKQPRHDSNECPPHWVEIERGFWIARTEITNEQYERFDPDHTRSKHSSAPEQPVVYVAWDDARAYCLWLSVRGGQSVDVPTETEWEFACSAGADDDRLIDDCTSWHAENSGGLLHEVAEGQPNVWGLFDLLGNAWEYCQWSTWRSPNRTCEVARQSGDTVRGGAFLWAKEFCRASCTKAFTKAWQSLPFVGIRPVVRPHPPSSFSSRFP